MNFVLHHHLAKRDVGTAGAAVGSMLPDFWRMVDRRMRPSATPRDLEAQERPVRDVLEGIAHHLWCDAWFHKHEAFLDGERSTAAALREVAFAAPKMVLMAHVLWELCLDGALLRRLGVDKEIESIQQSLDVVGPAPLRKAAGLHAGARRDADFDPRLEHLLERAAYGDWIQGYAHGAGIADRLAGVRRRIGLPPMTASDRGRLSRVCDRQLEAAADPLAELLDRPPASLSKAEAIHRRVEH